MPEINGKYRYGYIYLEETYAPIPEKLLRPVLLYLRSIFAQSKFLFLSS